MLTLYVTAPGQLLNAVTLTTLEIIIIAMLVLIKIHDYCEEHPLSDIYLILPNLYSFLGKLTPDGRCKSFDASADDYSRGEGAGVIVLKPLDSALADNNRIYAVIRGGALTNDGHSPGIAHPCDETQVELVRRACANAAVAYADIRYIEAHGTGTQVGDTTEANALGQTIGTARKSRDTPLYIGSVKSNISHCDGSAGIAGVIKTALALQHRQIPPVVHFRRGNEKIKFDEYNLKVPQKLEPWPSKKEVLAGVSSFGFGGANTHLVLEGISVESVNSSAVRKKTEYGICEAFGEFCSDEGGGAD